MARCHVLLDVQVGNKMDLYEQGNDLMVNLQKVELWAEDQGLTFIKTSAKDGSGVDSAFNKLIEIVMVTMEKQLRRKLSLPELSEPPPSNGCSC